jgi:hypothetical protein
MSLQAFVVEQSREQFVGVSEGPQVPSPQRAVVVQSAGQLSAVSSLPQSPSPQPTVQSSSQFAKVSLGALQTSSPQKQSALQLIGLSDGAHRASPQLGS